MKKNIVNSFLIITVFTVIERILGFVFKVYLSGKVGAETMGIYRIASSVFGILVSLSIGGIPLVCSKLSARNRQNSSAYACVASVVCASLSLVFAVIFIAVFPLTKRNFDTKTAYTVFALLPSLLFSALNVGVRSNMWGKEQFLSISVCELIEQVARIVSCIIMFAVGLDKLFAIALSLCIGNIFNLACSLFVYFSSGEKLVWNSRLISPVVKPSIPVTLSRLIGSVSHTVTTFLIPFLFTQSGCTKQVATSLLGSAFEMAFPILTTPVTLVSCLSFVLVPALQHSDGGGGKILNKISAGLKFTTVLACLFVPLFSECGSVLCSLLYKDSNSGEFLTKISLWVLPLCLSSITSSFLNALDMEKNCFFNGLIGQAVTWGSCLLFFSSFTLSALAFCLGLGWLTTLLLNALALKKKNCLPFDVLFSISVCFLLVFPTKLIIRNVYSIVSLSSWLSLLISALSGCVFYAVACCVLGFSQINVIFKKKKRVAVS